MNTDDKLKIKYSIEQIDRLLDIIKSGTLNEEQLSEILFNWKKELE